MADPIVPAPVSLKTKITNAFNSAVAWVKANPKTTLAVLAVIVVVFVVL